MVTTCPLTGVGHAVVVRPRVRSIIRYDAVRLGVDDEVVLARALGLGANVRVGGIRVGADARLELVLAGAATELAEVGIGVLAGNVDMDLADAEAVGGIKGEREASVALLGHGDSADIVGLAGQEVGRVDGASDGYGINTRSRDGLVVAPGVGASQRREIERVGSLGVGRLRAALLGRLDDGRRRAAAAGLGVGGTREGNVEFLGPVAVAVVDLGSHGPARVRPKARVDGDPQLQCAQIGRRLALALEDLRNGHDALRVGAVVDRLVIGKQSRGGAGQGLGRDFQLWGLEAGARQGEDETLVGRITRAVDIGDGDVVGRLLLAAGEKDLGLGDLGGLGAARGALLAVGRALGWRAGRAVASEELREEGTSGLDRHRRRQTGITVLGACRDRVGRARCVASSEDAAGQGAKKRESGKSVHGGESLFSGLGTKMDDKCDADFLPLKEGQESSLILVDT